MRDTVPRTKVSLTLELDSLYLENLRKEVRRRNSFYKKLGLKQNMTLKRLIEILLNHHGKWNTFDG